MASEPGASPLLSAPQPTPASRSRLGTRRRGMVAIRHRSLLQWLPPRGRSSGSLWRRRCLAGAAALVLEEELTHGGAGEPGPREEGTVGYSQASCGNEKAKTIIKLVRATFCLLCGLERRDESEESRVGETGRQRRWRRRKHGGNDSATSHSVIPRSRYLNFRVKRP